MAEHKTGPAHRVENPEAATIDGRSHDEDTIPYPKGTRLAFIIFSIAAAVFLVTLDETIIATAIPKITDEFNSLADVGWYGSAYFLTLASFQLSYGKLFIFFSSKIVFLVALIIFEIGSVVCATASSSAAFIIGRAVAGLGSAGINAGFIIILVASVPLERRSIFLSSYSMMYGIASVMAPIIGGAFASRLTWRWCFWINLPFGVLVFCVTAFLYKPRDARSNLPLPEKLRQLDVLGTCIIIVGISCLLLVLQWGGAKYEWNSSRIILLIVLSSLLTIAFLALQIARKEKATVPPRIICKRSVASSVWFVFTAGAAMNVMEYFLPIYFQATKGVSALESGIRILPMIVSVIIFALVSGFGVARWGYYTPFMLAGSALMAIGAGLITTWDVSTATAAWAGFQVVLGMGAGLAIQQAHTAAQTVLNDEDVPTGAVVLIFAQITGGAIFISVAENVLENRLISNLRRAVPGFDPSSILNAGATSLRRLVEAKDLEMVLGAYSQALTQSYYVSVGLAAMSFVGAVSTEWKSVKEKDKKIEEDRNLEAAPQVGKDDAEGRDDLEVGAKVDA